MTTVLDSRVIRITRWLLDQKVPRSTADLANDLGLSERVVRYRLGVAENYLETQGATLTRQRGLGLLVVVEDDDRARILADLGDRLMAPRVYTPEEREHLLIAALLWAAPEVVSLDRLNDELEVSKTSARRDLHRCEPWLERNGLPLFRKSGKGLVVRGAEREVRRAMVQLFLEAVPGDVLAELMVTDFEEAHLINMKVPAGLRDRFAALPLRQCAAAVSESHLNLTGPGGNGELVFALYVAVSMARCSAGRNLRFDAGQFVSLMDHPGSAVVTRLARHLEGAGLMLLPPEEIAGITEYLLGLDALTAVQVAPVDLDDVLDEVLVHSGEVLHASLADDPELRQSLEQHIGRLEVRLRHGLPVHNPLLQEVRERYPDVYEFASDVAQLLGNRLQQVINADEIGFLTMYFSGAMERVNLRPKKRALVVCPSGMATAWVLVSRIQAEFPELALVEVLSARAYEEGADQDFDLVISTIPLEEARAPVVVVSPLVSASDVRKLTSVISATATP